MADEEGPSEAAQAFQELRAEVTLMRRAVERLTAERMEVPEPPDYSETLGVARPSQTAQSTAAIQALLAPFGVTGAMTALLIAFAPWLPPNTRMSMTRSPLGAR